MADRENSIDVALEAGESKTFAIAPAWPGWARSGRGEDAALQTLVAYAPRYARVLQGTHIRFHEPTDVSALKVIERVQGNATTDFGAPDRDLTGDDAPVDADTLKDYLAILQACWKAFDAAVEAAEGKSLRKGPRGGGRELDKIIEHMRDVNRSYVSSLGGKVTLPKGTSPREALPVIRETILATVEAAVKGDIPAQGPRGGLRWTPRYFVRRLAWHELDHTWEIEDRIE